VVTARTQAACREKLELARQRDAGILQADKLTVAGYLTRWLEHKARQVKPRTTEIYRDAIARCIIPRIGRVPLAKLTALQVQTMVGELADQVGHTNPAFTMRLYTHLFDDDRRAAALSLADVLPARARSEPN
jgi:integrase